MDDMERSGFEYYFDDKEAQRIIKFAELCRHWKGKKAGRKIQLEEWQRFIYAMEYGWREKGTKLKRFRTHYVEVARKNGKTSMEAIKALYHLLIEKEQGAQIWSGATKEEQARIVVNDAGRIAQRTPELKDVVKCFKYVDSIKRLVVDTGYMSAFGRDSKTSDGFDPSMGIIDEYHAHKDDNLLNVIESGMGSREQPVISIITTAGFEKANPCYSVTRKTVLDILERRKFDDRVFGIIFTLDAGDDWKDPAAWGKANPNLGASIEDNFLNIRFQKAINEGASKEVDFKTKNLNIWTDAAAVWIQDETWLQNAHGTDIEALKGRPCFGGLDLAKGVDINSFVLLFPDIGGKIALLPFFWIPEDKLKTNTDAADYFKWVNDGYIIKTNGSMVDIDHILYDIKQLSQIYDIQDVAFDRWFAFNGIVQGLIKDGLSLKELGQGYASMTHPTIEFENLCKGRKFEHFNNPVLRWMLSNTEVERDAAGNPKPSKGKSVNKIDGIVAAIDAVAAWLNEKEDITKHYNTNRLRTI